MTVANVPENKCLTGESPVGSTNPVNLEIPGCFKNSLVIGHRAESKEVNRKNDQKNF